MGWAIQERLVFFLDERKTQVIHSRSLTASLPLKNDDWKLEDYFPFGKGTFQGQTVKLQVGT